jgi:hypothetical protein
LGALAMSFLPEQKAPTTTWKLLKGITHPPLLQEHIGRLDCKLALFEFANRTLKMGEKFIWILTSFKVRFMHLFAFLTMDRQKTLKLKMLTILIRIEPTIISIIYGGLEDGFNVITKRTWFLSQIIRQREEGLVLFQGAINQQSEVGSAERMVRVVQFQGAIKQYTLVGCAKRMVRVVQFQGAIKQYTLVGSAESMARVVHFHCAIQQFSLMGGAKGMARVNLIQSEITQSTAMTLMGSAINMVLKKVLIINI